MDLEKFEHLFSAFVTKTGLKQKNKTKGGGKGGRVAQEAVQKEK